VAASDTFSANDIGSKGLVLLVTNGSGGSINVTVADPGRTRLGNTGTAAAQAVADTATRVFWLSPDHVDPSTGVATVTYSGTTSVTWQAYRLPG
jgi:hypothetical protein